MASEITGLANLRGYLKMENLVVRLSVPFIDLPEKAPAFAERPRHPPRRDEPLAAVGASITATPTPTSTSAAPDVVPAHEHVPAQTDEGHELSIE
jgi:hypothetical protein